MFTTKISDIFIFWFNNNLWTNYCVLDTTLGKEQLNKGITKTNKPTTTTTTKTQTALQIYNSGAHGT